MRLAMVARLEALDNSERQTERQWENTKKVTTATTLPRHPMLSVKVITNELSLFRTATTIA